MMGNKRAAVEERRCSIVYMHSRADRARIEVKSYPEIRNLIHKYAGKDRTFNFHERFKSESELDR